MRQEGWQMLTRAFANLRYMTPLTGIAAGIGTFCAFAPIPELTMLLSGPVVAVYGIMLYLSRGVTPITSLGATLLGLTSLFHIGWVLATAQPLQGVLAQSFGVLIDPFASMVAATGVVFATVIACITVSWRAFGAMLVGTSLATACEVGIALLGPIPFLAPGIAILHLSIVATLLFTTLATIAARERPGVCKSCGYDLAGNVGGVCPECGFDALHPTPHPFDVEVTSERPRE